MAKLERVFGLTACSSSISIDQTTGLVAYPAGSTVVVHNPRTLSQANLSAPTTSGSGGSSAKNHQLTCLAFSDDGHYICTGEFGAEPKVRVWQLQHDRQTNAKQLAELKYHRLGIACVAFTKTSHQLISIGNQHDKSVVVWDWRKGVKLAENRLTSQVNAMDVSESGRMFVTVGVRHVKFWYLEMGTGSNGASSVTLQGRSAILADHRNNTFVDVCCAPNNRTFAITVTKLLVEFVDKKLVNIYELGGETPYALTLGQSLLFIGFGNGAIRALNIDSGEMVLTLRRPHRLGFDGASADTSVSAFAADSNAVNKYPDVHCMVFHAKTQMLTVFYSDRSVYHWQVEERADGCESIKISSQFFHVGPLFDVQVPTTFTACMGQQHALSGVFFTAGADETIRMWNLDYRSAISASTSSAGGPETNSLAAVANELQKILYVTNSTDSLSEQPDKNFGGTLSDALESTTGIRCIRFSANNEHLACGGRDGNIYIFDVSSILGSSSESSGGECGGKLTELEAHNGEILCLDYSDPAKFYGRNLLASGSRDRLIHIFDANNGYDHVMVVGDHACSISTIRFVMTENDERRLITCGTDKLVVINELELNHDGESSSAVGIRRLNQISGNVGANYVCSTQSDGRLIVACQDRQIRTFSAVNGELLKIVAGSSCNEGTLTKLCLDPSETFAASVCSDRFIYIVDLVSGDCVAALKGQTDCITAIQFSPDCRRLIVVSYNGCIFVWRFSATLIKKMNARLAQIGHQSSVSLFSSPGNRCSTPDSVIESDSASAVAQKNLSVPLTPKCGSNSGSEFGSLTSVNIVQEDDLDSGIDGRTTLRHTPAPPSSTLHADAENRPFELKRISVEAVRRSNSNLHGLGVVNSVDVVTAGKEVEWSGNGAVGAQVNMQFANGPAANAFCGAPGTLPNYYQYTQQQQQQQQIQQQQQLHATRLSAAAPGAATSRSMSNLSHNNVSPQRGNGGRRRWNVAPSPVTVGGPSHNQQHQMFTPTQGNLVARFASTPQQQIVGGPQPPFSTPQYSQQQHYHQQQQQLSYANKNATVEGLSASVSLNTLRASAASPSMFVGAKFTQQTQSAPRNGAAGDVYYPPSHFSRQNVNADTATRNGTTANDGIERKSTARNSFSKRYLKNIEQEKTLWKPGSTEIRKRTTSSLFSTHQSPQRQNAAVECTTSAKSGLVLNSRSNLPSTSSAQTPASTAGVRTSRSASSISAAQLHPRGGHHINSEDNFEADTNDASTWASQHEALTPSNGIDDVSPACTAFSPRSVGSSNGSGGVLSHRSSSRVLSRIKQQRRLSAALLNVSSGRRVDLAAVAESAASITTSPLSSRRANGVDICGRGADGGSVADLRARSKSPTQLAMHALVAQQHQQQQFNHQRESSSGSSRRGSSSISFVSQRRQTDHDGSVSRLSNVRQQSSMTGSPMEAKLNEARAMLKKSQENLTALSALGGTSTHSSAAAAMARSRSIGNLRFGAAAAGLGSAARLDGGSDYLRSTFPSSAEEEQGGTLLSGRQMARSVNSLLQEEGTEAANQPPTQGRLSLGGGSASSKINFLKTQNAPGSGGSRLAQSIRELRKNSNPDLTNEGLYEMDEEEQEDQFQGDNPYYSSATIPKNLRRGVQKKLERNNDVNRRRSLATDGLTQSVSTLSVSGDDGAPTVAPKLSLGSAAGRYISYATPARSVSSVEPRANHQRRTFDSLGAGGTTASATRRAQNYLAQNFVAPDVMPSQEELSSATMNTIRYGSTTSIDALTAIDTDVLHTQNSKKMAMHTSECIQEMIKACDKLLGARHLICNDATIVGAERDALVSSVDRAINAFRHRLDGAQRDT